MVRLSLWQYINVATAPPQYYLSVQCGDGKRLDRNDIIQDQKSKFCLDLAKFTHPLKHGGGSMIEHWRGSSIQAACWDNPIDHFLRLITRAKATSLKNNAAGFN